MSRPLIHPLTWTDQQLSDAVKASANWRSVMRALGYGERSSSAGAIRIVRRRAAQLGLDSSHFRGKRRWSDAQLRQAVTGSRSWVEVLTALGLSSTDSSAQPHVKSHTIRLGLDTSHLNRISHRGPHPSAALSDLSRVPANRKYLRVAGPSIAAAWFAVRVCAVSFPFEPTAYDLLVDGPAGIAAVQVKTTTNFTKDGWTVTVGHHPDTHAKKGHLLAYDPDVIDLFFIVDGDMTMYLIPSRAVAGRVRIVLRTYRKYAVGNLTGLIGRWEEGSVMAEADIEAWLGDVGGALGVPVEDVLPEALRSQLLELTGDIAHNVVRVAVPLTSYLIGVAVGRGASPADALRIVGELVPEGGK